MERKKKIGLPPGTLVYTGTKQVHKTDITVLDFNENTFYEYCPANISELCNCLNTDMVSWINMNGLDVDTVKNVGECFNLHALLLEDILSIDQRPKIIDYDDYLHFTFRMLMFNDKEKEIISEQVSIVLGPSWVISFQETEMDVFDPIRERIRNAKGRVRKNKSDYLAYLLLDIVVDNYFLIIEEIEDLIDKLEIEVMNNPDKKTLEKIQNLKNDLLYVRKSVLPLRDAIGNLQKGTSSLIHKKTTIYLKDAYDHTLHICDNIDLLRETLSSVMEVYLSTLSNRLNSDMKVLTVISTIFIPLTFIVGVYGMNFDNMPELHWTYGYYYIWAIMIVVALGMIIYLKRKKWM